MQLVTLTHAMNSSTMKTCEIASQVESFNTGCRLKFEHQHVLVLNGTLEVVENNDGNYDLMVIVPGIFSGMKTIDRSDYDNAPFIQAVTDHLLMFAQQMITVQRLRDLPKHQRNRIEG